MPADPPVTLREFRADLCPCLSPRRDALFDLGDVLLSGGPVLFRRPADRRRLGPPVDRALGFTRDSWTAPTDVRHVHLLERTNGVAVVAHPAHGEGSAKHVDD